MSSSYQSSYDFGTPFDFSKSAAAPAAEPLVLRTRINEALKESFLSKEHPQDVRFYFPKGKKELWASSIVLSAASPYLQTLLKSDFEEGKKVRRSKKRAKIETEEVAEMEYDDSDDEGDDDGEGAEDASTESTCDRPFHTIVITAYAFKTYRAVLAWIITGEIHFSPLTPRSHVGVRLPPAQATPGTPDELVIRSIPVPVKPDASSPKSLYRLSHLLEISDLQLLARNSFQSQLTSDNVLQQLFSDVSASYDVLQACALRYATLKWDYITVEDKEESEKSVIALPWSAGIMFKLAKGLRAPNSSSAAVYRKPVKSGSQRHH